MTGPTIWIPGQVEERPQIGRCYTCGRVFYDGEQRAATGHFKACATAAYDALKSRETIFDWDPDPEVREYLENTVGPRMRKEGRLEVKPNERAGFS